MLKLFSTYNGRMGSVHKQGWGDWPLCKTHDCSINDGAACKHGLFSQSHDSFSHTVEFSLLCVRFLLYSVHDYICLCSASETCHLQVIECIQLFTWLNFCIRFIPSPFLCINHLHNIKIKQGYICDKEWARCVCRAASLNSLISAARRLNWPEEA